MHLEHDPFSDDRTMVVHLSWNDVHEIVTDLETTGETSVGELTVRRGESTDVPQAEVSARGLRITLGGIVSVEAVELLATIPNERIFTFRGTPDSVVWNLFGTTGGIEVVAD